jgi:UDP-4-amino-4,6-dideoxy-L-N-acetyl-beta-L-altrosamine transaminase
MFASKRTLREKGVGVQTHYKPVYRHSFYRSLLPNQTPLPNAEAFYEAEISIPCHAALSDNEVAFAIDAIRAEIAAM